MKSCVLHLYQNCDSQILDLSLQRAEDHFPTLLDWRQCPGTRISFHACHLSGVLKYFHGLRLPRTSFYHTTLQEMLFKGRRFVYKQKLRYTYLVHVVTNLPDKTGNFRPTVLTQQLTKEGKTRKKFRPSTNYNLNANSHKHSIDKVLMLQSVPSSFGPTSSFTSSAKNIVFP